MSWSIVAGKATKAACERQIREAKCYGADPSEQASFEAVRATLLELVGKTQQSTGYVTVIEAAAQGHGTTIVAVSVRSELVQHIETIS